MNNMPANLVRETVAAGLPVVFGLKLPRGFTEPTAMP